MDAQIHQDCRQGDLKSAGAICAESRTLSVVQGKACQGGEVGEVCHTNWVHLTVWFSRI